MLRLQVRALGVAVLAPHQDRAAAQPGPLALAVVQHRLLDVEHAQHLRDHLVRDIAGAAGLQHPGPFDVDQNPPPAGVALGRGLRLARSQLFHGREVAALHPGPDLPGHVVRVVLRHVLQRGQPGLGGLVEQGRAGQSVGGGVG